MSVLFKRDSSFFPFDVDDFFDDLVRPLSRTRVVRPNDLLVRSASTDSELTLSVDLPGVKKENVEITFEPRAIRIVAKRSDLGSESKHSSSLSEEWDRDSAEATLADGVLVVRVKKLERSGSRKLIVK